MKGNPLDQWVELNGIIDYGRSSDIERDMNIKHKAGRHGTHIGSISSCIRPRPNYSSVDATNYRNYFFLFLWFFRLFFSSIHGWIHPLPVCLFFWWRIQYFSSLALKCHFSSDLVKLTNLFQWRHAHPNCVRHIFQTKKRQGWINGGKDFAIWAREVFLREWRRWLIQRLRESFVFFLLLSVVRWPHRWMCRV